MGFLKLKALLLSFLLCIISSVNNAQDPVPVQRATDKVIIDGNVYFIHAVKAGQTLFSISKAYNLSVEDIEKENPGVFSGLQIGQVLKIPLRTAEITPIPEIKKDTSDYIHHYLKEGETLFFLSRKYEVSQADIERDNPGINPLDLKIGQLIYILKPPKPIQIWEYKSHRVRRKETIYGISRKYGISEDELIEHNPELLEPGLKTGKTLNIPKKLLRAEHIPTDELFDTIDEYEIADTAYADKFEIYNDIDEGMAKRAISIAYLIPFNYQAGMRPTDVEENELLNPELLRSTENENPANLSSKPASIPFLEFLEGSFIALDSLKKSGVSVNVRVFDTQRSPSRVKSIISSGELDKMDMIFGPFFSYNVEPISEFSKRKKIPLIVPFHVSEKLLSNNPYLFQVTPSFKTEIEMSAQYLARFFSYNIVFIYSRDTTDILRAEYLKSKLFNSLVKFNPFSYPTFQDIIYDPSEKKGIASALDEKLSRERKNLVIIPSTSEAMVSVAVSQLFFQLKSFDITLFGMPQWSVFQNVDLLYFHKLNLRFLSPYYFSYYDQDIRMFLAMWRNLYRAEPSSITSRGCSYAFLGHDITWHFVKKYHEYGPRFIFYSEDLKSEMLMVPFEFRKGTYNSGFENKSFSIVRYNPDLTISKEDFLVPYRGIGLE